MATDDELRRRAESAKTGIGLAIRIAGYRDFDDADRAEVACYQEAARSLIDDLLAEVARLKEWEAIVGPSILWNTPYPREAELLDECRKQEERAERAEADNLRLRTAAGAALRLCPRCDGTGRRWTSDRYGVPIENAPCPVCGPIRRALDAPVAGPAGDKRGDT